MKNLFRSCLILTSLAVLFATTSQARTLSLPVGSILRCTATFNMADTLTADVSSERELRNIEANFTSVRGHYIHIRAYTSYATRIGFEPVSGRPSQIFDLPADLERNCARYEFYVPMNVAPGQKFYSKLNGQNCRDLDFNNEVNFRCLAQ